MDVQFIASIAVIAPDPSVSRRFYVDTLGLPLMGSEDDYLHSEDIDGSKSFGVWPLTQAAQACFGTPDWPADRPVPSALEFVGFRASRKLATERCPYGFERAEDLAGCQRFTELDPPAALRN